MTRQEIQEITVKSLKKEIEKHGPDHTFLETPKFGGRCRWTLAEALAAAEGDTDLEYSDGVNPVTDVEHFIDYCNERGMDWREYLEN